MVHLPEDILIHILYRLPVKSLLRFKCINKRWRSMISDRHFADHQLRISMEEEPRSCHKVLHWTLSLQSLTCERVDGSIPLTKLAYNPNNGETELRIVGSCNGLVCLLVGTGNFVLCNPATREVRELPKDPATGSSLYSELLGLGYDSSTEDYKFLGGVTDSVERRLNLHQGTVYIFSLKSNSWRRIPNISANYLTLGYRNCGGNYLNGSLYWIVNSLRCSGILSFDLTEEKFHVHKLPQVEAIEGGLICSSKLIQGLTHTGKSLLLYGTSTESFHVWEGKELGGSLSWSKLYNISSSRANLPSNPHSYWRKLLWIHDGKILFQVFNASEANESYDLCIYNIRYDKCEEWLYLDDLFVPYFPSRTTTYFESLVSPFGS